MKLFARPEDDLDWQIGNETTLFEFELGLNCAQFPLEDELYFNALAKSLTHFTQVVWPRFPNAKAILYRGSADFSKAFHWTERQEANFLLWKEDRPISKEAHLKRLFCAEAFVTYFQMLAHKLPDELPISLHLNADNTGTLAETLHLLSPERFDHFQLETSHSYESHIGVCFPPDAECSEEILRKIDKLLITLPSFRPVYENLLTEQWDGLDILYVFPEALTERGKRKLKGFEAAGGEIVEFRGRGI